MSRLGARIRAPARLPTRSQVSQPTAKRSRQADSRPPPAAVRRSRPAISRPRLLKPTRPRRQARAGATRFSVRASAAAANNGKAPMRPAIEYVRHHAIAILALICSLLALAGASYASFGLPAGSVGARQLRDNSITPAKFNHKLINGAVRAWAIVAANGHVIAGGGNPKVRRTPAFPAQYVVLLGSQFAARVCVRREHQWQPFPGDRGAADEPNCRLRRGVERVQGNGSSQQRRRSFRRSTRRAGGDRLGSTWR